MRGTRAPACKRRALKKAKSDRAGTPLSAHAQVFHELEQFVSDPHFVAALDRPSKEGKAGLLQRWTNWAHSGSKKVPTNAQNSEAVSCCEDK